MRWYDAAEMGLEGQGWRDIATPYDRLPARAESLVRPVVWQLSQDSAGLVVRFQTDATRIAARWKVRKAQLALPYMAAVGVSGLDLYAQDEQGRYRWAAIGRPLEVENEVVLADGIAPGLRGYMLYLPLYNGIERLEIGLPDEARLIPQGLRQARPIVYYGTSITQGAAASRPGMCQVAILGRRLDWPMINLGFSGNALMEPEIAELLAELDPVLYVLDAIPNMVAAQILERAEHFVRTLRAAHARTPIVLVEDRTYGDAWILPQRRARNDSSRAAFRQVYRRLLDAGISGLAYIEGEHLLGDEAEATEDGSHPTPLGFAHMADVLEPVLRALLPPLS
jgi:lysophospholipase L1-like esterase